MQALAAALMCLAAGGALAGPYAFWQLSYEYENDPPPRGEEATYGKTLGDASNSQSLNRRVDESHPWGHIGADLTATLPSWANAGLLQAGVRLSGVIGGVTTCTSSYPCNPGMTTPWTAARARAYAAASVTDTLTVTGTLANPASTALVFHWSLDGTLRHHYVSDPPNVLNATGTGATPVALDLIDISAYMAGDLTMTYRAAGLPSTFQRIHREHMYVTDFGDLSFTPEQTQGLEFLPDATVRFGWHQPMFEYGRPVDTTGTMVNAMIPLATGTQVSVEFTMASIAALTATNFDHPGLAWELESDFESTARLLGVGLVDLSTGRPVQGDWGLESASGYRYTLFNAGTPNDVPEPSTLLLLLAPLMATARRRKTARRPGIVVAAATGPSPLGETWPGRTATG
jgi:hypothetical protein